MTDCTYLMQPKIFEGIAYRFFVPEGYNPAQKYPLVLFLHGMGECGSDNRLHTSKNSVMQTLLEPENLAAYPCVVLAPQCPQDSLWPAHLSELMGLLERTKSLYSIDSARIYITGLSMGGFGTWAMLTEYPDYFAAAAPVCGGGDEDDAAVFRHVPLWVFHGAKDSTVHPDASREMVKALQNAGAAHVKYTEYPDAMHDSWELAYRESELFPWMFGQRKS